MPIDRKKWIAPFKPEGKTQWQCSKCEKGDLVVIEETFSEIETLKSRGTFDSSHPDDKDSIFVCLLQCSHEKCRDIFGVAGNFTYRSRLIREERYDPATNDVKEEWNEETSKLASPVYLHPAPYIVQISNRYPTELIDILKSAFSLFWSDLPACANRLRSCAEQFLTLQAIPKEKKGQSGKVNRLFLNERIKLYKKKDPTLGEYLVAVRLLGNEGSHYEVLCEDKKLTRDDVLDAFIILSHVLSETYIGQIKEIEKIVSEIIRENGPRSRKITNKNKTKK